jgi:hypothetical protein
LHYTLMACSSHLNTGVFITLGMGPIYCRSSKQKGVSASSTEAEVIAFCDAFPVLLWLRLFIIAQGYDIGPLVVNEDNTSGMAMMKNGVSVSHRTRHFTAKHFLIKEAIDNRYNVLIHCRTNLMLVDMFTKALQGRLLVQMANWAMTGDNPDTEIIDEASEEIKRRMTCTLIAVIRCKGTIFWNIRSRGMSRGRLWKILLNFDRKFF